MKIAYLYDAVYPFVKGGAERRIYEIATRLASRGHEVHVFGMELWEGGSTVRRNGLQYHSLGKPINMYHRNGRRSISQALQFGAASLGLLRSATFDVIDCGQWPYFHLIPARLYSWLHSTKLFVSWYEVWGPHWYSYLGRLGMLGCLVERSFSRIPDGIIAVSELTRDDLLTLGVPRNVVEMIPNGIDYGHIRAVPRARGRAYDVVSTGRLKNHKNLGVLLEALRIAKNEIPDISAIIIGEGPEHERLLAQARELSLSDNVTFTGGLADFDEVVALMKCAKVFVNASTKEGGGSITLFEANACGLPVIAVRCPHGIDSSLIEDGENGYMVESLSPELIARRIVHLVRSPELLEQNAASAIGMAAQYDWDAIATQHENLYARSALPEIPCAATCARC